MPHIRKRERENDRGEKGERGGGGGGTEGWEKNIVKKFYGTTKILSSSQS